MDVRVGLWRRLSTEELMLLNCGVGEDSWGSLGDLSRRCNHSILKEISSEYSLEGLMLKLKLQYFGYLVWITDSFEKTLMLGKIEDGRRKGGQRMRCLDGITDLMEMSLSKLGRLWWTGRPGMLQSIGSQGVRHDWATELNWDICSQVYYVFLNCIFVSRVWALWVLYSTSLVLNFLYVLEFLEELLKNPLSSPSS